MRCRHVRAAQPAGGGARRPARGGRRAPAGGADSTEVRGWPNAQGIDVKDRGRVPADRVARFKAATPEVDQGDVPVAGLWRLTFMHAGVCVLGRLVTRVCAMTSTVVARLVYQMLLARMSPGQ
jgi:Lsr2